MHVFAANHSDQTWYVVSTASESTQVDFPYQNGTSVPV